MHIKIYFNDKPLFLCDELTDEINVYAHHDDAIFIDEFSSAAVNSMIHEMRREKVHAGIYYHSNIDKLKKAFWKKFVLITAGGGLVENEMGEFLFIFRKKKWDLPKGKLDKGESIEACSIREVKEETGLNQLILGSALLMTYHTYDENGKHHLKETQWFAMTASKDQNLKPQQEEDISEIKWVNGKELLKISNNTYPSVLDVLKAAGSLVQ